MKNVYAVSRGWDEEEREHWAMKDCVDQFGLVANHLLVCIRERSQSFFNHPFFFSFLLSHDVVVGGPRRAIVGCHSLIKR
jgi:hypothetical protein